VTETDLRVTVANTAVAKTV